MKSRPEYENYPNEHHNTKSTARQTDHDGQPSKLVSYEASCNESRKAAQALRKRSTDEMWQQMIVDNQQMREKCHVAARHSRAA